MLLFLGDNMKITFFDTISSTNLYLKENYLSLNNLECVVAKHQTAGRGRLGRTWQDSDDLLMSILIKDNLNIEKIESLSLLICSSIFKVLKRYLNNVQIKWPNDILVNGKKICGILLESVFVEKIECVVLGFGVNVNHLNFDLELKDRATSLLLELKEEMNVKDLAREIYEVFIVDYNEYINGNEECFYICKNNSYLIDKKVIYNTFEKEEEAIVRDILKNGHILLETSSGLVEKSSGEITFHYNYKQSD